jgi:hypothetical protein
MYAYLYIIICTPQIAYCPGNCTGAVNGQQKKNKNIKKKKKKITTDCKGQTELND